MWPRLARHPGCSGVLQQVEGPAVERRAGHDVVTRLGDIQQTEGRRGLPRGDQEGPDATLQGGDPLLHRILGGVHDAGVDIAELLEGEQVCRVFGVPEGVRRGLVDRQGPSAGGRIGALAGVNLSGLKAPGGWVGHRNLLVR